MKSFSYLATISALACIASFAQVTPPFSSGGHTYNISSAPIGVFLNFSGHWLYEPSVISPSPATGNQWVMLFNSNLDAGVGGTNTGINEAIFLATSSDGKTAATQPQAVLYNTSAANVCDMIDARPIWDGSLWHVYTQVAPYPYNASTHQCSPPAFIAEATGPSLTQLAWVLDPGTNNATEIIQCNCTSPSVGIGEAFQVFNTQPYDGYPSDPYLIVYNNWAYNPGSQMFAYLTNFSQYYYWYNVAPAYTPASGAIYADVVLDSPSGSSTGTNFAYGAGSSCTNGQTYYYMNTLGFYPTPVPYPSGTPQDAITVSYQIQSESSDGNGQRGFVPRFARNEYGYLDVTQTSPNTWTTYVYYNDSQISKNPGDNCGYTNWSGAQRFSVSQVTFTQQ